MTVEGVVETVVGSSRIIKPRNISAGRVRAIGSQIRVSTTDVSACLSAERRRAIRVAVISISSEARTVEAVVIAAADGDGLAR